MGFNDEGEASEFRDRQGGRGGDIGSGRVVGIGGSQGDGAQQEIGVSFQVGWFCWRTKRGNAGESGADVVSETCVAFAITSLLRSTRQVGTGFEAKLNALGGTGAKSWGCYTYMTIRVLWMAPTSMQPSTPYMLL